nr:uncharacterized protein LOC129485664 [Symphalangus syndactylus]
MALAFPSPSPAGRPPPGPLQREFWSQNTLQLLPWQRPPPSRTASPPSFLPAPSPRSPHPSQASRGLGAPAPPGQGPRPVLPPPEEGQAGAPNAYASHTCKRERARPPNIPALSFSGAPTTLGGLRALKSPAVFQRLYLEVQSVQIPLQMETLRAREVK